VENITRFVAGIVDANYPDLTHHHRGVGDLAVRLARRIGSSFQELRLLSMGAQLHDIGKLSIDTAILDKPAPLSRRERAAIEKHPGLGHRLIQPLGLDKAVEDSVLHHHENLDGSGYPAGLKGSAIPFFARILRICDCYDALTRNRAYHRGRSAGEALTRLQSDAHLYDPELLASFCDMIQAPTPDTP